MCTAIFLAGRLQRAQGHLYLMTPVSRNLWGTTAFNEPSFEFINFCLHCYQSRGPAAVRARAESLTDPDELASYGNGAWPLLTVYEKGETAANGNYLEPDSIAVRHGICGDPEQKRSTAAEGSNRYENANSMYPGHPRDLHGGIRAGGQGRGVHYTPWSPRVFPLRHFRPR
ncbi:unnamed protein product [Ascophyllum nodosum]